MAIYDCKKIRGRNLRTSANRGGHFAAWGKRYGDGEGKTDGKRMRACSPNFPIVVAPVMPLTLVCYRLKSLGDRVANDLTSYLTKATDIDCIQEASLSISLSACT